MQRANGYIKAVIELEFDQYDVVNANVISEYIKHLSQIDQLHVRYFDAQDVEHPLDNLLE